jgi:hypothetical protein
LALCRRGGPGPTTRAAPNRASGAYRFAANDRAEAGVNDGLDLAPAPGEAQQSAQASAPLLLRVEAIVITGAAVSAAPDEPARSRPQGALSFDRRSTIPTQMSVGIRADVSRSSRFDVSAGPDAAALRQARHDGRPGSSLRSRAGLPSATAGRAQRRCHSTVVLHQWKSGPMAAICPGCLAAGCSSTHSPVNARTGGAGSR